MLYEVITLQRTQDDVPLQFLMQVRAEQRKSLSELFFDGIDLAGKVGLFLEDA